MSPPNEKRTGRYRLLAVVRVSLPLSVKSDRSATRQPGTFPLIRHAGLAEYRPNQHREDAFGANIIRQDKYAALSTIETDERVDRDFVDCDWRPLVGAWMMQKATPLVRLSKQTGISVERLMTIERGGAGAVSAAELDALACAWDISARDLRASIPETVKIVV